MRLPYSNFSSPWGFHVRAGESVRDYSGSLKLNHSWPHSLARTKSSGPNSVAKDTYVVPIWVKGNQGSWTLRQSLPLLSCGHRSSISYFLSWWDVTLTRGWDVTPALCSSPFPQCAFSYFYTRKIDLSLIIYLTINHSQDCKDLQGPNKVTICNIGVRKSPLIKVPLTLRRASSFSPLYQCSCLGCHGMRLLSTGPGWGDLNWDILESRVAGRRIIFI